MKVYINFIHVQLNAQTSNYLFHLHSLRVPVSDMIHTLVEVKPEIVLTGAARLTVGDWVEVSHDFSPGHNSAGGVGVITEVVGN